jgi:hypothetical protein|tara:strand:+ start:494 stop:703 length:210 start_codon:yes stop_codon:yes gene_type:complete
MNIILTITPIRVFVNGKLQKEKILTVKPDDLLQYGFTQKEIDRISDGWDVNHIKRRDANYIYKASPKYN